MTAYDLGDPVTLTLTVRDPTSNALLTPTSVTLTVTAPDGTATTSTPAPISPGVYSQLLQPATVGLYFYRWVTTGPGAGAESGTFTVLPSVIVPTVADLRQHLNNTKAADEAELKSKLAAAVAVVERAIGPILPQTFTEKVTSGLLRRRPVTALVSVDGFAPTATAVLDAEAGLIDGLPYGRGTVVYTAGWGPRPDILEAVLVVAARLWETQRSAATGPLGVDLDGNPISTGGLPLLPPRAQALLAPYSLSVGIA